MLVDFYCSGRDALYVCCGWCMPDGAFPLSGVIVNNIKLFGRIDLNLLTLPASFCAPSGWGLVGFFLYVILDSQSVLCTVWFVCLLGLGFSRPFLWRV